MLLGVHEVAGRGSVANGAPRVQAVPKLLETIPGAAFVDAVLPPLLKAADDRVPNVKFNLCKVLQVRARARRKV